MKTYRTTTQWQMLLQQRALLAEYQPNSTLPVQTTNPTSSRFIQLKQTTTEVCAQTHQNVVQFDIRTGQLMFPANLATNDIIAIIKGLIA